MKIVAESQGGDIRMSASYHPACFSLPRKYATGADKMTPGEFVADILQDQSDNQSILPSKADELAADIGQKKGNTSTSGTAHDDANPSPIAFIKAAYEARKSAENDDAPPPPKKKSKKEKTEEETITDLQIEIYEHYHKTKNSDLQQILEWNHQYKSGNKDYILLKVIDGIMHGRLAPCGLCGGTLKLHEDGTVVACGGRFDEDSQRRIPCAYSASPDKAPRFQPFFTQEPTDDEKKVMEHEIAVARGDEVEGNGGEAGIKAEDEDRSILEETAAKLPWTLTSRDGLRQAATGMVQLFTNHKGKRLAVDEAKSQQKIGQLIATQRDKSAKEMVGIIIKEFGWIEDKEEKAAKKEKALESSVKHPENARLVQAFDELAKLYFAEGNSNAGGTYKKVVAAIANLDFVVTAENAKGLGKGKTKIPNIGPSSAEKAYEFCKTGTMQKLEEKRADAS